MLILSKPQITSVMRILILNSIGKKKWGGGEKWMLMAAGGLIGKGHEVFIGCSPRSIIRQKAELSGIPVVNISFNSDFDLIGAIRLVKVLKQQHITHLICVQNKDTKIGAVAALCVGGISIYARHGLQLIRKKWKYRFVFSKLLDGIITNSNSIKQEYDSYGWFSKDFVKVIFNGIRFPENIESFNFHTAYNLPKDAVVIFSAGRLAKQKGFNVLIDVAAMARQNKKNWYFFIAGKGKLERQLKQRLADEGLNDRVRLMGFMDDVLPYVQGADLFVLPSFYEGMPNAVMEAMALGKCCVVTAVNGNNELITEEQDGILVEPRNVFALFNALNQVAEDSELRKTIGARARLKMKEYFQEAKMVENLEGFLLTSKRQ